MGTKESKKDVIRRVARLIPQFKKAIAKSPSSNLEIAWSLNTDINGLNKILELKVTPNGKQLEEIQRFVGKSVRATKQGY